MARIGTRKAEIFGYSFDETNTSYHSDVCDRQSKLWRNEIIMPNAFKGLELNVGITYYNTNLERIIFI